MECPFNKEVTSMKEELKELRESAQRHDDYIEEQKKRAGYRYTTSFDTVFSEILYKSKCWDFFLRTIEQTEDKDTPNIIALTALIRAIKEEVGPDKYGE